LLATVAALVLVPAAQAFAGTFNINMAGTGSGTVEGISLDFGTFEETFYNCSGPPPTGVCESSFSPAMGGEFEVIADEGSEFTGWTEVGGAGCEGGGSSCSEFFAEEGSATLTAHFASEGPSGPELTVTKEGTGSGTVVSSPAGIECGATCTAAFTEGSKVTLTASPSAGSLFVSWKGCEKGGVLGRQCTVTMDKAKTVNAKFLTAYDVTVNRVGSGLGKVSSSPGGVLCLSNCSSTTAAFKEGTSVTLSAAPSKNFVFTEWTGDCSGAGPCSLGSLGEDKEVGAKFTEVAKHLLTVNKSGGGQGTAKSNLAGINCGATCSTMASAYYQGAVVELTATPGKGSAFGGWSGAGCSGTGTCTVTMSAAKSVTAEFK
jgi:hypothetical protein